MLADFGLTVFVESKSKELVSTRHGHPKWQAPELWGEGGKSMRPTYAGDIYSWAMVCIEVSLV